MTPERKAQLDRWRLSPGEMLAEIERLEEVVAKRDSKINELAIARDKEFWRTYADHTHKELLRSTGALTAKLAELGRDLTARDERIHELEREIASHRITATVLREIAADAQAENAVLREAAAEAWSAHGEVQRNFELVCLANSDGKVALAKAHERILELEVYEQAMTYSIGAKPVALIAAELAAQIQELERQLAERDERIRELTHNAASACQALQDEESENERLEQQLKSTQERLAEAEMLLHIVGEIPGLEWSQKRKEYFEKHEPEKTERG